MVLRPKSRDIGDDDGDVETGIGLMMDDGQWRWKMERMLSWMLFFLSVGLSVCLLKYGCCFVDVCVCVSVAGRLTRSCAVRNSRRNDVISKRGEPRKEIKSKKAKRCKFPRV